MDRWNLRRAGNSVLAFYLSALLWLPAGLVLQAAIRFGSMPLHPADLLTAAMSLLICAPLGLPLPLACRWLSRKGYPRAAWITMIVLGLMTVIAALFAGLLGPLAIAIAAVLLSVPVWIAAALAPRRT